MSNKILCFDYGERYVGVAVADLDDKIALRHSTIDQKEDDAVKKVAELASQEKVDRVLVSVPVSLSGEETAQTHVSLAFIEKLRAAIGGKIEVEGVDEMFTSKEARRVLKAEGGKPGDEHMEAARLMLADYIAKQQGR